MDSVELSASAPLGFLEKLRVLAACGAAIVLLWTIGWRVAAPIDPQMALTLNGNWARTLAVWPTILALAAVAAAVGTILIGRRLPEAGILAAAVGLAAMSLPGGSMQMLLAYQATNQAGGRRALMANMLVDCLLWTAILAVCWIIVAMVRAWLWAGNDGEAAVAESPPPEKARKDSAQARAGKAAPTPAKPRAGWTALVVCTVVAVLVIWSTASRTPVSTIARGQVIASVAGGLFLGALAARYFTGISDPKWYVLAAPAAGLIGYLLGYLSADMAWAQGEWYQPYAFLATTPPHDLVRPLPIEYVAVGVAGALLGFWWSGHLIETSAEQDES
jgi:hypothetical protein